MPTVTWNLETCNHNYDWKDGGEEWSAAYGDSTTQWLTSLWPRLCSFISPDCSMLEIAPGHGRWTKFILHLCKVYTGIDMADKCINACIKKLVKMGTENFM